MTGNGGAKRFDLAVIGAGSGGIGAALAAARDGIEVLLLDAAERLGGTAVLGGVSIWEMGAGGTGIPFDIYRQLRQQPKAVGIYTIGRHCLWSGPAEEQPYPGGELRLDAARRYTDTLRRYGARSMRGDEAFVREHWHGAPFEPDTYESVVRAMLAETGHCTICTKTTFSDVTTDGERITGLRLTDGTEVRAWTFVDATGDVALAAACGVATVTGQESRAAYGEPDAPEAPTRHLNGTTLIYRVAPTPRPAVEPLPPGVEAACWWQARFPMASIVELPGGDLNVNMLPTMSGEATRALGREAAYAECRRRVLAHWHHLQVTYPEFRHRRLHRIAPTLGIREGPRIVGRYVLREQDLLAGILRQGHRDIVALADHAMDTHGASTGRAGCVELAAPYGIPFRCLLPRGRPVNLMVACRGASFSSLAASSCRLSRTMLQLGQAAGTAAAMCAEGGLDPPDVPIDELRDRLRRQHVQLTHPMPTALRAYLEVHQ